MSVKRAMAEIDSREFAEWAAYDRIDPIGPKRYDAGPAIVAQTVARCHGNKSTRLRDFMPVYKTVVKMTDEQMRNNLRMLFRK